MAGRGDVFGVDDGFAEALAEGLAVVDEEVVVLAELVAEDGGGWGVQDS